MNTRNNNSALIHSCTYVAVLLKFIFECKQTIRELNANTRRKQVNVSYIQYKHKVYKTFADGSVLNMIRRSFMFITVISGSRRYLPRWVIEHLVAWERTYAPCTTYPSLVVYWNLSISSYLGSGWVFKNALPNVQSIIAFQLNYAGRMFDVFTQSL